MRKESRFVQLELVDVSLDTSLLPTELFYAVYHQLFQRAEAVQVDGTQVGVCLECLWIVGEGVNRVLDRMKCFYLPIDKVNTVHLMRRNILRPLPD